MSSHCLAGACLHQASGHHPYLMALGMTLGGVLLGTLCASSTSTSANLLAQVELRRLQPSLHSQGRRNYGRDIVQHPTHLNAPADHAQYPETTHLPSNSSAPPSDHWMPIIKLISFLVTLGSIVVALFRFREKRLEHTMAMAAVEGVPQPSKTMDSIGFAYQELPIPAPAEGPPAQELENRMEVTKHNFLAVAEELEKLLDACDFVAFDEEMTGINLVGKKTTPANAPAENYRIQKEVAERFAIIQIGICPFLKDPSDSSKWVAYPFNFFVFPEVGNDVVLSPAAITFNRQHGMDFQKWICQGVPYVNSEQEQALREKTWPTPKADEGDERPAKRQKLQKEADQTWFAEEWAKFESWMSTPFLEDREFQIMEKGPVQRKYFESQVKEKYPDLLLESRLKNPGSGSWARNYFVAQRTEASKAERLEKENARREAEYHRKVGFHRIFKALITKKKPLVGHNLLFDLLFMMAAFHGPLPETWDEWKAMTHEMFPMIYDTKYLAQSKFIDPDRFETTALEYLFNTLSAGPSCPKVHLPLGFEAYSSVVLESMKKQGNGSSKAHEAAYDAYMTGTIFLSLMQELRDHSEELVNRANLMFSAYELYFCGPDPLPHGTGPILHVTFETKLDNADLLNCFGNLPGKVRWINESSALACMAQEVELEAALQQLRGQAMLKTVQTFDEFRAAQQGSAQ